MIRRLRSVPPCVPAVLLAAWAGAFAAPLEIFEGVRMETETRTSPRPLKLHWLGIDLKDPGVG